MCFLAIAVRESIRLLSDELGGRELSLPQVSALMALAAAPEAVLLADLEGVTPYDLSILGDGLGRSLPGRGLVKTAKDGRRVLVSLTAKGEALRARLEALEAGAGQARTLTPHAVPAFNQWPRRGLGMVG
jgi:DNA-binding MarR family transcriptional regulator